MGLDNVVYVKIKLNKEHEYIHIPAIFPHNCEDSWLEYDLQSPCLHFEMIYWRKWWGPRNKVVHNLQTKYGFEEEYCYYLDSEDIEMIIDVLEEYNNKVTWNEDGSPVWRYEDNIKDQIDVDINVLKRLAKFMRTSTYQDMVKNNTIEVYFIDSY